MQTNRHSSVLPDVTHAFGGTPLIELGRVPRLLGVKCRLVAKAEFLNVGGSVKDRIALSMVLGAEGRGEVAPGDTLVEATSGNTGIGLALVAIARGYRFTAVCTETVSDEKLAILKCLGAQTVRTSSTFELEDPRSAKSIAHRLDKLPGHFLLDQYNNPDNTRAHFEQTGAELAAQVGERLDFLFCGAGSCGTITGLARRLKQRFPDLRVVGVDPVGSVLARLDSLNDLSRSHLVEGIGQKEVPGVLDYSLVDSWVKVEDEEAFARARDLIRLEGLMVGGSAGACLAGALKFLKAQGLAEDPALTCALVLPDSMKHYLTKFCDDGWMVGHGFAPFETLLRPEDELAGRFPRDFPWLRPVPRFGEQAGLGECLAQLRAGLEALPIFAEGALKGIVTPESLIEATGRGEAGQQDTARQFMRTDFCEVG